MPHEVSERCERHLLAGGCGVRLSVRDHVGWDRERGVRVCGADHQVDAREHVRHQPAGVVPHPLGRDQVVGRVRAHQACPDAAMQMNGRRWQSVK